MRYARKAEPRRWFVSTPSPQIGTSATSVRLLGVQKLGRNSQDFLDAFSGRSDRSRPAAASGAAIKFSDVDIWLRLIDV
jgi:hypothetical protein